MERIVLSIPQPEDMYSHLIGSVERFRDTKGDGGCFMEVLQTVTQKATLADIFHRQGQLDDGKFIGVMTGLNAVVDGLPSLQSDQALAEAFEKLGEIEF